MEHLYETKGITLMSGMTKNFITDVGLQSYFVDKDTGAPMAGGYAVFFKDSDRTVGKNVFEKIQNGFDESGAPLYEFVPLGNVVRFSGVGTFMDNDDNDIAVYYYPWDANGDLELYFVQVYDIDGTPQFTREGWPDTFATDNPDLEDLGMSENQISNPQFVVVNFEPTSTFSLNFLGSATTNVEIAPDWILQVIHTADTNVTIDRIAIPGDSNFPTQSPYYLKFTSSSNISSMKLIQKLSQNPGIWSPGFIATSIVLGPGTPTTKIFYVPSTGSEYKLLEATNASTLYVETRNTFQLPPTNNPNSAPDGFVSIVIDMSTSSSSPTTLSSVQVVGLNSNIPNVPFEQITVNRQIDHLYHYYNLPLLFKPIPTYLTGWDFPLNPAQFLGSTILPSGAANTSKYVWDQTIMFQSEASGIKVDRSPSGALILQASVASKVAIIQYLPQNVTREMLTNAMASMLTTHSSPTSGIKGTITLWYTTDATLPDMNTGKSIVLGLDDNGRPNAFNGSWTEVPRINFLDARFTSPLAISNDFTHIPFTGWDSQGDGVTTATFFAIVVGTETIAAGNAFVVQSVSLNPGAVPTIPPPQNQAQVLLECQQYYWKTFVPGVPPGNTQGFLGSLSWMFQGNSGGVDPFINKYDLHVRFPTPMIRTPAMLSYNPTTNTSTWFNKDRNLDSGVVSFDASLSRTGFGVINTPVPGDVSGQTCYVHLTADARLGY